MSWEKILKADVDELEKIAKELDKAVEMHRSQAERIRAHIKAMKSGGKNTESENR
tara:strand:- start:325 stop:489 length:165 start_codon:yes stop_codon:yes gene_type:complete